jgi:hypothetical protein
MFKQQKEFNDKVRANEEAAESKAKRLWEETVASRSAMVEKKRSKTQLLKAESERAALLLRERAAEELEKEVEMLRRAKQKTYGIKELQLKDAAERRKKNSEAIAIDRERQNLLIGLYAKEDEKFQKICHGEIEKNIAQGKPIVTLLKALRFKQPEFIPAVTIKQNN